MPQGHENQSHPTLSQSEIKFVQDEIDTVFVSQLHPNDGFAPIPRRDHTATLLQNKKYFLVFGGKNDGDRTAERLNQPVALDDLMIFDIEKRNWMCIVTYGFSPSPRWGAALAVAS